MKSDKQWGWEVARGFEGLSLQTQEAIAIRAAHVVRHVRREDGKVLKPAGWTPPHLDELVGEEGSS